MQWKFVVDEEVDEDGLSEEKKEWSLRDEVEYGREEV